MLLSFLFLAGTLYIAQIGDKTQILTLLLASRTKKHVHLYILITIGFSIGVTIAVLLGAVLTQLIPHKFLELLSGVLFIIIGGTIIFEGMKKVKRKIIFKHNLLAIPLVIFLTDLGDKTQIAIALFATNYHPLLVWIAAMVALSVDTAIMIYFSKAITKKVKENVIKRVAGIIFIILGAYITISHL